MNQAQSTQECDRPRGPAMLREPLPLGTQAPDFELRTTPDQKVALSSLIGNPVVLLFCPAAWSPVCAYATDRWLRFPLLSDLEPEGEVSKRYGAYECGEGVAARALFVLDRRGKIVWSYVAPIGINPGVDGILDALEARKEMIHA